MSTREIRLRNEKELIDVREGEWLVGGSIIKKEIMQQKLLNT